ncbi:MAG: hypothetical protein IKB56_06480 [Clostridia bacterium]|nr:hypothetical protein [Clostridia bacterium]
MKKTKILICSLLCVLAILGSLLVGCSGDGSSNGRNSKKEVTLTLIGENGVQKEAVVKYDVENTVETMYKSGYYFNGYYDAVEGGTQYFSKEGKAICTWQEHYPTTLYAQFRPVKELFFKPNMTYISEALEIKGDKCIYYSSESPNLEYRLPFEMINAAKADFYLEMNIKIMFRYKDTRNETNPRLYISDTNDSSGETYYYTKFNHSLDYQDVVIETVIPSRSIQSGKLYFSFYRDSAFYSAYIKDFHIELSYTGNSFDK